MASIPVNSSCREKLKNTLELQFHQGVSCELQFQNLKPFLGGHRVYPGDPQCGTSVEDRRRPERASKIGQMTPRFGPLAAEEICSKEATETPDGNDRSSGQDTRSGDDCDAAMGDPPVQPAAAFDPGRPVQTPSAAPAPFNFENDDGDHHGATPAAKFGQQVCRCAC